MPLEDNLSLTKLLHRQVISVRVLWALKLLALSTAVFGPLGSGPYSASAATVFDARPPARAASSPEEQESLCERRLPPTKINVKVVEPAVEEVNDESVRSLTAMRSDYQPGHFTFGLTTRAFTLAMASGLSSLTLNDSRVACLRPNLEVKLTMDYHRVSIARELQPGTCLYDEVRAHEYRHVQLNRQIMYWAAGVIEKEMKDYFGNKVLYGDPRAVQAEFQNGIRTYWMPRLKQLDEQGEAGHAQIDTPEEYARLARACNRASDTIINADATLRSMRAR